MPKAEETVDVWSVQGRFQRLVYSPKGGIEGFLIETDGVPTQFVVDPQDGAATRRLADLATGQALTVEGIVADPSPKGEAPHVVYAFERLVAVDGRELEPATGPAEVSGKIVAFNHAKHGAPNGVVLDSGDFIHTRPHGMAALGLRIGDEVRAEGPARPLATGHGRVIEARTVNGRPVGPAH